MTETSGGSAKIADVLVRVAWWPQDAQAIWQVRERVFILEQGIPAELEWDGQDESAWVVVAETPSGEIVGTVRLLHRGQVGRMAVLPSWRHLGIGSRLFGFLAQLAVPGNSQLWLDAQTNTLSFYQRLGFQPVGDGFVAAGIPHQKMIYSPDRS